MYFILKLIILLEILFLVKCRAYVLTQTTNEDLPDTGITHPPSNSLYIDNMLVKPQQIREPKNLQEIVNYIGADKFKAAEDITDLKDNNEQQTLTYTELSKLLAFWQWAKEQNFYEMQTETTNIENNNFETLI